MIYFPSRDRRISIPLFSYCSGKVDESSFYISPDEFNPNLISDIKTFKPSHQISLHRRLGETNPGSFFCGVCFSLFKIYTLGKGIDGRQDYASFVPPCGTAGDRYRIVTSSTWIVFTVRG
jgi:hypothetical protein